jgi:cysteinyl-tRNA synthetase
MAGVTDLLLEQRQAARKRRDFGSSDAIRDRLAELGIVVEDTPDGARWRRSG